MPQTRVLAEPPRHRFDDLDTDGIPRVVEERLVAAREFVARGDPQRGYLLANAVQIEGCNMHEHGITPTARDVGASIVAAAESVMRAAVDAGAFPER